MSSRLARSRSLPRSLPRSLSRLVVLGLVVLVTVGASGCTSIGPRSLRPLHVQYNEAILHTLNEQLLLNLVRLRYRENPYFLEIGSVTSQQTFSSTMGLNADVAAGPDMQAGKNLVRPSLGMAYSITPTIVLAPLQGELFLRKLMAPIPIASMLTLTQSGWSIARVLALTVDRIRGLSNAPTASGPTPRHAPVFAPFKAFTGALRELQLADHIVIGVDNTESGAPGVAIQLRTDGNTESFDRVVGMLGLAPRARYRLTEDFLAQDDARINIKLRSVLGVMFYLSTGVHVPSEHSAAGLVTTTRAADGTVFDWDQLLGEVFRVEVTESEPPEDKSYVKVKYRGFWFFVRDNDLESKSTFMLLSQLFSMQAGQVGMVAPALTLPLGR